MQVSTGNLYPSRAAAYTAGVEAHDLVELSGPPEAIAAVSDACRRGAAGRDKSRARRKTQRESRKRNR